MRDIHEKMVGLLDYVEQVVRLDERVALRVSEYKLLDGSSIIIQEEDTRNLPAVRHDLRNDDVPIWLEVERLARRQPPTAPADIADWIVVPTDPARMPEAKSDRILTVTAAERDQAIANGEVRAEDVMESPRLQTDPKNSPLKFDLRIKLADRPVIAQAIADWIAGPWTMWATEELPRRRTIALYQRLYKLLQLVESTGGESSIEVMWGIGAAHWKKDGRTIDRPLLERRVDIEIDDKKGGVIRIRPTIGEVVFDLKPYEEIGCDGLPLLADLIRKEIRRASEDEGISPFQRETFEPILIAAAARLDQEGTYASAAEGRDKIALPNERLLITDKWVLFARPRSQHIILQDIERLRRTAQDKERPIGNVSERLVTEPSSAPGGGSWTPLSPTIGTTIADPVHTDDAPDKSDIFFPKPFNDDQIEIVRRLQRSDGLVVQGPPGTGKTHTIANLICHAMATGQRVLVVSRGEAALAVLREQLPKEVRSLAISILSSERQGVRQVESAIREVQAVVDGKSPAKRLSDIRRLESEIVGLKQRIDEIDLDLDTIASAHLTKMGPRQETPAELARRVASEKEAFRWFTDRPQKFASETDFDDEDMRRLTDARVQVADLIDHIDAQLPTAQDLPTATEIVSWHEDLVHAQQLMETAKTGPARSIRAANDLDASERLAEALKGLAHAHRIVESAPWLEHFRRVAVREAPDPWMTLLSERISEWDSVETEWVAQAGRTIDIPGGLLEDEEACKAITRAANGERLWPLLSLGKGQSKALVELVTFDGKPIREQDTTIWNHVAERIVYFNHWDDADVRWQAFVVQCGAAKCDSTITLGQSRALLRSVAIAREAQESLPRITLGAPAFEQLSESPSLALALADQIGAAIGAVRLAKAREEISRASKRFEKGTDQTSIFTKDHLAKSVGNPDIAADDLASDWQSTLSKLERIAELRPAFQTIKSVSDQVAKAGAPLWAEKFLTEAASAGTDPVFDIRWRDAWDHAAADAALTRIDSRDRLLKLAREREEKDRLRGKLFADVVRERTFYELERRLSPSVKSFLVQFVRSLARIGKGTGKGAGTHRRAAREALEKCYEAIPCWIMPTWRVAEQLPPEFGSIDLVILDEASQSDVTELPALVRGRKILVVGDDRQVSPTAPFVTQAKIQQLRHHFLQEVPFGPLLEPGESLYDLMRAVFPDERLMLKEHFRCVEPIIQFSMQFYPEKMLPLRIPSASERLDPPLIDIYIPHGVREDRKKINSSEAKQIVKEIEKIVSDPSMRARTIGVISLIGVDQANYVRALLSESIGEELMQRHSILCGDSATFQGNERDIVFLSMVSDSSHRTALTMQRYEQRYNVAASRARDRLILIRSVRREELNPYDLKSRLIAHFENPMPEQVAIADDLFAVCDSDFERDVLGRLLKLGYKVQPQVGSLGYRIDMVVEGADGRRLAIECDGDRFHGPEQWREDMRRQRVLERVGWRFWRCFASSYYRNPDSVIVELTDLLSQIGIEPAKSGSAERARGSYTEHRVVSSEHIAFRDIGEIDGKQIAKTFLSKARIGIGDRVVLIFAKDGRKLSVKLTRDKDDSDNGLLSINSTLGQALMQADEGEEIDFEFEGHQQKVLIEMVERAAV
jgi:very-short-patch-repair endonuclease